MVRHQTWNSLAAVCYATASQLERQTPERGTPNPTARQEWHESSLPCWWKALRCAAHDICPTVVKWGTRVLFCPFCPRQKVAVLRKQAQLRARKQAAAHRCSLRFGLSGYSGLGSAAWDSNSSSFWKTEGGGPVSTHLLKEDYKIEVRNANRPFLSRSWRYLAEIAKLPQRVTGTCSHCCKTGIALIQNLICKVRERMWILNINFKALRVSPPHSPVAPVHANLPRQAPWLHVR